MTTTPQTPAADPVAAWLDEVRELAQTALDRPRTSDAAVARFKLAPHVPALLAGVEAVLSNHAALLEGGPTGGAWCPTCYRIWPCETYKAITRELLGKEEQCLT